MSQETADIEKWRDLTEDRTAWDRFRENWLGYLFVFPTLLAFLGLFYFPLVRGIWLSFHEVQLGGQSPFVGLDNFVWMLTNDLFVFAVGWSLIFVYGELAIQLVVGMLAALLVNEVYGKLQGLVSAVLMSPFFAAPVAGGVMMSWFLSPDFGFLAKIFTQFGMEPIAFLSSGFWPYISLIVAQAWHDYAYVGIIYGAAISGVPASQYEAAAIDGANRLRRFRDVTLPYLVTPTVIILATRTAWNLAEFAQPFELTGGGPGTRTMLLSILTYETAYVNNSLGRAYAIGMGMIAISVSAAIIYVVAIQEEEELYM